MADNSNPPPGGYGGWGGGSGGGGGGPYNYDQTKRFNPTTAAVIISLIGACFLLAFVSVSVRRCIRGESVSRVARTTQQQSDGYTVKAKGLDKAAVDALPLVHRADLDEDVSGECPVCLTEFEPDESLRLLPSCKHVFHQECIDAWFDAHSTCPLCRASLLSTDAADATPFVLPLAADPPDTILENGQSPVVPATTPALDTVTESGIESEPVKSREPSFRKPSMRITGDLIALRNLVMRGGPNDAPSRRWFKRAQSLELGPRRVAEREEWVTIDLESGKAEARGSSSTSSSSSSSSSSGAGERAMPVERAWSERWSGLRGAVRFPLTRSTSDVSSSHKAAILPI